MRSRITSGRVSRSFRRVRVWDSHQCPPRNPNPSSHRRMGRPRAAGARRDRGRGHVGGGCDRGPRVRPARAAVRSTCAVLRRLRRSVGRCMRVRRRLGWWSPPVRSSSCWGSRSSSPSAWIRRSDGFYRRGLPRWAAVGFVLAMQTLGAVVGFFSSCSPGDGDAVATVFANDLPGYLAKPPQPPDHARQPQCETSLRRRICRNCCAARATSFGALVGLGQVGAGLRDRRSRRHDRDCLSARGSPARQTQHLPSWPR